MIGRNPTRPEVICTSTLALPLDVLFARVELCFIGLVWPNNENKSLVWIAFWGFLWLQASAAQLTEDCLVAISNGTDGTSVILDCGAGTSEGYEALLRDQYLSPLIRPPSVLVTHNTSTTNKSSFAIFLPLSNSLGVVELTYKDGWTHNHTMIDIDCKIISVHQVLQTYFTACLDRNEKLVMHRLYMNNTHLNVSFLKPFRDSISVGAGSNFSNIAYATLQNGQSLHRLYVAVGSFIYSIAPLDQHITPFRGRLPSVNCHTLEYVGDWVLLATCTDSGETYSVHYGINDKRVLNTTQGTDTVLFLCPQFEDRIIVRNTQGKVLYRNWSSNADTEFILRGNVHSGVCFGNNSKMASLSFAYSNDEARVYAINISHGVDNDVQLSSNACLKQNCQSVFTLDKYLVVQEREHDGTIVTQVRDPARNHSIEFEVNSDVAGVALVKYFRVESDDPDNDTNNALLISILATVLAVLLGVVVIVVLVSTWVYYRCWHSKHRGHHNIFQQPWHCDSPDLTISRFNINTTASVAEDDGGMRSVLSGQNLMTLDTHNIETHKESSSGEDKRNSPKPNETEVASSDKNGENEENFALDGTSAFNVTTTALAVEDNSGVGSVLPGQSPLNPATIAPTVVVEVHNKRNSGEDKRNDLRNKAHQMHTHATHYVHIH